MIKYRFTYTAVFILFISLIGLACASEGSDVVSNDIERAVIAQAAELEPKTMVGKWKKIDSTDCSAAYPNELEFIEGGVYLSERNDDVFLQWQSGDFEVIFEGHILMQTATDAMVEYEFSLSDDDILTFIDESGCEFRYERLIENP